MLVLTALPRPSSWIDGGKLQGEKGEQGKSNDWQRWNKMGGKDKRDSGEWSKENEAEERIDDREKEVAFSILKFKHYLQD